MYLEVAAARVAPIVLANETMIVPVISPKRAPEASVRIVAPGSERVVVRMYIMKKIVIVFIGF